MSITPIAYSGVTPASLNGQQVMGAATPSTKTLNQQDFLTLLAKQFETQDPMQPMSDTSYIAQMAQFTSLQQMSDLTKSQQMLTGNSYLGLTVTVQDPANGNNTTGVVTAIDNTGATPAVVINGTSYPVSEIKNIQPTSTPAATTPSSTGTSTTTTPAPLTSTNLLSQLNSIISNRVTQGNPTSTAAASTPAA
jgi:flagellar basal-body rod modification protein FlgD